MNSVIFIKSSSHRSLQIQSHPGTIPGPRNIFLQLFIHPVQDNLVIHLTFMFIFFLKKNDPLAIDPGLGRNPYKIRSIFIYIISSGTIQQEVVLILKHIEYLRIRCFLVYLDQTVTFCLEIHVHHFIFIGIEDFIKCLYIRCTDLKNLLRTSPGTLVKHD